MKICTKCNKNEITYRNPKTGNYAPYCKECRKAFDDAYAKSDKRKAVLKKYNNKPTRKKHMKEYLVAYGETEDGRKKIREKGSRWRAKHMYDLEICARRIAWQAKKCGLIKIQPCEVCGTTENLEMHHPDYTKPMDVRWLCKQHHKDHHDAEELASATESAKMLF